MEDRKMCEESFEKKYLDEIRFCQFGDNLKSPSGICSPRGFVSLCGIGNTKNIAF